MPGLIKIFYDYLSYNNIIGIWGAERLLVKFSNIHSDNHEIHIIYLKGEPNLRRLWIQE